MAFFMKYKYPLLLLFVSFLLTNIIAFLDEGIRTFEYLNRAGDWVALIIYSILFLIIPLLIFFLMKKTLKERFLFSLLGFIPAVFLILLQLR